MPSGSDCAVISISLAYGIEVTGLGEEGIVYLRCDIRVSHVYAS